MAAKVPVVMVTTGAAAKVDLEAEKESMLDMTAGPHQTMEAAVAMAEKDKEAVIMAEKAMALVTAAKDTKVAPKKRWRTWCGCRSKKNGVNWRRATKNERKSARRRNAKRRRKKPKHGERRWIPSKACCGRSTSPLWIL